MPQVVDIRESDDPRDVIHRAVHLLADGEIVALPTESGYVLAANLQNGDAVVRLSGTQPADVPFTRQLALKSAQEVRDYAVDISRLGGKLTRRCWPGPVAFVLDVAGELGLSAAIPPVTRTAVISEDRCCFRVPADRVFQEVLQLSPAPLVLGTEHGSNSRAAAIREADGIAEIYGDEVALIVDGGPTRYDQPETIVEVAGNQWKCVRPGVVNETILGRLASEVYLFVCTGNTCRSPIAEGWFRKLLAERLQCGEDELVDHGYLVASAGISASFGSPASPEAVTILAENNVDLHAHESRPLTDQMLDQADHIFTMTRGHRESILSIRPDLADTVRVLSADGSDVPDPMGFGMDEYRHCEQNIQQHVRAIIDGIEFPAKSGNGEHTDLK